MTFCDFALSSPYAQRSAQDNATQRRRIIPNLAFPTISKVRAAHGGAYSEQKALYTTILVRTSLKKAKAGCRVAVLLPRRSLWLRPISAAEFNHLGGIVSSAWL